MNKLFALTSLKRWEEGDHSVNLKCDPDRAEELRAQYDAIYPGYHMSKKHWNTVDFNRDVPDKMNYELIDHTIELVASGFANKQQGQIANL